MTSTALYDGPVSRTIQKGLAGRPPGLWGMVCLIATEAALFALLLFSYYYVGATSSAWPPQEPPPIALTAGNTLILLASSATIWWAQSGIEAGQVVRLRIGLFLSLVLGTSFICLQGVEWSHLPFAPASDSYGSLFYTITGFHGAHVIVGLLMIAVVFVRALLGHFSARRSLAVRITALYWHFVDVVWLFVFTTLYIAPRL